MRLSQREKLTFGLLSASVGIAAFGVAMKVMKKRQNRYNDFSDDEEEDDEQHLKFLQRDASRAEPNESSRSMGSHILSALNSSRLNVFNSSRLNDDVKSQNDSMGQLHDLSATQLLPDNVRFIDYGKVITLLKQQTSATPNYVIFDLREMDYTGGHIAASVNIAEKLFYDDLAHILSKYHNISSIIVQCMDGSLRSIQNMEYYVKAVKELIIYYNDDTQCSYYYKYTLKMQHSAHKTVMRSIRWNDAQWMERFVEKTKVEIDFSKHEEMYNNLKNQKLFVMAGGFFEFINTLVNDKNIETNSIGFHSIVADFNRKYWEELNVMGQKKLYHKNEYYTTRRINPLRKTQTKREF